MTGTGRDFPVICSECSRFQDWPEPTAKAELKIKLIRLCEVEMSTEGSSTLVSGIARLAAIGTGAACSGGILWMGLHSNQIVLASIVAAVYASMMVLVMRKT